MEQCKYQEETIKSNFRADELIRFHYFIKDFFFVSIKIHLTGPVKEGFIFVTLEYLL